MTPGTESTGQGASFNYEKLIASNAGANLTRYEKDDIVYSQGDAADFLFYIVSGMVKISVFSEQGREAVTAFLGAGDFFGEGCLGAHLLRASTITTTSVCEIARLDRALVKGLLAEDHTFAGFFMEFLLGRNEKLNADLVDQLFNSSEKRLARILLTLANAGVDEKSHLIPLPVSQELLANMVGTTRSRINQFMNKFRKLGYVEYNGRIRVHNSLLSIILNDGPHEAAH